MDINEYIAKLWNDGKSAAVIAREVSLTRNAVMGRIGRMRYQGAELRRGEPQTERLPRVGRQRKPTLPPLNKHNKVQLFKAPKPVPIGGKDRWVSFLDTKDGRCRYIEDDLYCNDREHRASYCEEHYKRCYMRMSVRPNTLQKLIPWRS